MKRGNDKKFKPADLEAVAVIENFALCVALGQVDEKTKDRESVLKEYEISEEEFEQAERAYRKYEKTGMMDVYDGMFKRNQGEAPNKIVHYTAGSLEMRPSEARRDLGIVQVLKGNSAKDKFEEKSLVVYSVSQMVIDNIMRDPELTPEEKNMKICELELAEYERVLKNVEEANRKQNTDRYKIARENEAREIG